MFKILANCLRGLEVFLAQELSWHGFEVILQSPGSVVTKIESLDELEYLHRHIRICEDLDLLIYYEKLNASQPVEYFEQIVSTIDFSMYFHADSSFAVRCFRKGSNHRFNSVTLMQSCARVMAKSLREKAVNVKANLKNPDLFFRVKLIDDVFSISLRTNTKPLSDRYQLPVLHEAPINRCLAAALIWSSSYFSHGQLLDPMCGGATLLIEAALWKQNLPLSCEPNPAYQQQSFWSNLKIRNLGIPDYQIPKDLALMGADRSDKKVRGAWENFKAIVGQDKIFITKGNAKKLKYLSSPTKLAVSNPPYGMRVMTPKAVDELYKLYAQACYENQIQEVVAVTPKKSSWLESFEYAGYQHASSQSVFIGDMPAFIIKQVLR